MNYYASKMWAPRSRCFSPHMNNWHSRQLKKSKSWRHCQSRPFTEKGLDWLWCLAGSFRTATRILMDSYFHTVQAESAWSKWSIYHSRSSGLHTSFNLKPPKPEIQTLDGLFWGHPLIYVLDIEPLLTLFLNPWFQIFHAGIVWLQAPVLFSRRKRGLRRSCINIKSWAPKSRQRFWNWWSERTWCR